MGISKAVLGIVAVGTLIGGPATTIGAASSLKSGTVHVHVTGSGSGAGADIILTGVIGDFGTAINVDKHGTPDNNGNYVMVELSQGTFRVNITSLNDKTNKQNPSFDSNTCSAELDASAPAAVSNGTGIYKGIKGTLNLTISVAFIGPKITSGKHIGQCSQSQSAQPIAQGFTVSGSGNVSYS